MQHSRADGVSILHSSLRGISVRTQQKKTNKEVNQTREHPLVHNPCSLSLFVCPIFPSGRNNREYIRIEGRDSIFGDFFSFGI